MKVVRSWTLALNIINLPPQELWDPKAMEKTDIRFAILMRTLVGELTSWSKADKWINGGKPSQHFSCHHVCCPRKVIKRQRASHASAPAQPAASPAESVCLTSATAHGCMGTVGNAEPSFSAWTCSH